jgi:hypothetical protein
MHRSFHPSMSIPWRAGWPAFGLAAILLVAATAARAGDDQSHWRSAGSYEIDYTDLNDPTINGDLIITTMATSPSLPSVVISIRGERDGDPITGLSPYARSDQRLYPSGLAFDFGGLSFATANDGDFNLFSNHGAYYEVSSVADRIGFASSGMPIRVIVKTVPEPASLALLGAGCGAIAWVRRRRRIAAAR